VSSEEGKGVDVRDKNIGVDISISISNKGKEEFVLESTDDETDREMDVVWRLK